MAIEICKTCKAQILWATFASRGVPIPIDPVPVPHGNLILVGDRVELYSPLFHNGERLRHQSHFASCKHADQHRRRRRRC